MPMYNLIEIVTIILTPQEAYGSSEEMKYLIMQM